MNKKIAAAGGAVLAGGLALGLAACGGGSPETPSSVLVQNGYTVVHSYTAPNMGGTGLGEYGTAVAVGDNSTDVEVVLQLNAYGRSLVPGIEGDLASAYPGVTSYQVGDFLVAVVPLSDAGNLGSN